MVDQLAPATVGGIEHPVSRDWIIRGHLEPNGDQIYVSLLGPLDRRHSQGVFWVVASRPRATAFMGVIAATADKPFIPQIRAVSRPNSQANRDAPSLHVSAIVIFSTAATANLLICCMNGMLFT